MKTRILMVFLFSLILLAFFCNCSINSINKHKLQTGDTITYNIYPTLDSIVDSQLKELLSKLPKEDLKDAFDDYLNIDNAPYSDEFFISDYLVNKYICPNFERIYKEDLYTNCKKYKNNETFQHHAQAILPTNGKFIMLFITQDHVDYKDYEVFEFLILTFSLKGEFLSGYSLSNGESFSDEINFLLSYCFGINTNMPTLRYLINYENYEYYTVKIKEKKFNINDLGMISLIEDSILLQKKQFLNTDSTRKIIRKQLYSGKIEFK